jgi:predicted dehydrogenase
MKIVFFGLGSIGQRHARLLAKSGGHELLAMRTNQGDAPAPDFPVQVLKTWDQVDRVKPHIAFITNPTSLHIPTAMECAKRGMALFMEKPLGGSEEGLDELLDIIQKKTLVTYVAYVMRFHPVILHLKGILEKERCCHLRAEASSCLATWRPGRDHKKSYSSKRSLGGGIVFDLSHEIDYVEFLLGKVGTIEGSCARRSNVTLDTEDCADIHMDADRGFASVHLSYLSHLTQRRMTIYFPDRTLVADLINNNVSVYQQNVLSRQIPLPIERDDLFQRQLDFFLANIRNPDMMNNIPQAADLFRKICCFREKCYAVA